jgi:hypothetical protein
MQKTLHFMGKKIINMTPTNDICKYKNIHQGKMIIMTKLIFYSSKKQDEVIPHELQNNWNIL